MIESAGIQTILAGWGASRKMNDAYHLGYPHSAAWAKEMRNSGQWAVKDAALPDDMHQIVDAVISLLRVRRPRLHEALLRYYVLKQSDTALSKAFRVSRHEAKNYRIAAEAWVDSRLCEVIDPPP